MNALGLIQAEIKAPKGQRNDFGKYNYRSCEDILEAVKPLLKKHDAVLTITDTIEAVGSRVYVKALVKFEAADGCKSEVSAFAREAENKKGMDEAQITGAASSYARKYALSGLFLLDDTKDADSQDNRETDNKQTAIAKANYKAITKALSEAKFPTEVDEILKSNSALINSIPQAGKDGIKNLAAEKRTALGG